MSDVNKRIEEIGVVPVIKLTYPERDAKPLADALCEGGLPVAEVTFRAAGADTAIRLMKEAHPEMLVGAGTVMTTEHVDKALAAGAEFIVTPGFDGELVQYCQEKGIAVFPGCTTPTDYHAAYKFGLEVLKFFPAEQFGGIATIKALAAPYTNVKFMPTGGISAKNLPDYLSFKKIVACGGSWMVKGDMIEAGEFDKIRDMTKEAVELVAAIRKQVLIIGEQNNGYEFKTGK